MARRGQGPGSWWRPSPWSAYAQAIGIMVIVILFRAAPNLAPDWPRLAWLLVLAFVLFVVAAVYGPGPGLTATALTAGYALWALVLPLHLDLASLERVTMFALLLLAGVIASLVSA